MEKSNLGESRVSGILLAAGASSRLGNPKQKIVWQGQYLINFMIDQIISSNIHNLIVVLGHQGENIKELINKNVKTVLNTNWKEGKSTSIKTGMSILDEKAQGVMFFVVDQPFINIDLINKLLSEFEKVPNHIIVPNFKGRICNPVLFPKIYFKEFFALSGEQGGKEIIRQANCVKWVSFKKEKLFFDIDTLEDYKNALSK